MIYLILWTHWFADFVLQTDAMAKGKSSSNAWLLRHIGVYTSGLYICLFGGCLARIAMGLSIPSARTLAVYCLINGLAHLSIDYVTSRITKRLWAEKRVHDFFVVIGFDQALHMTTLMVTLPILGL